MKHYLPAPIDITDVVLPPELTPQNHLGYTTDKMI